MNESNVPDSALQHLTPLLSASWPILIPLILLTSLTLTKVFSLSTLKPHKFSLEKKEPFLKGLLMLIFLLSSCIYYSASLLRQPTNSLGSVRTALFEGSIFGSPMASSAFGLAVVAWCAYVMVMLEVETLFKKHRSLLLLLLLTLSLSIPLTLAFSEMILFSALLYFSTALITTACIWRHARGFKRELVVSNICICIASLGFLILELNRTLESQTELNWMTFLIGSCFLLALWAELSYQNRSQQRLFINLRSSHQIIQDMIKETQVQLTVQTNEEITLLEKGRQTLASEVKATKADLNQTLEELKSANRHKRDFMRKMSHEFNTPLNGMLGSLSLIDKKHLPKGQADYVSTALVSVDRLMHLVNNLIDLNQLNAGDLHLQPESCAIESIMQSVFDQFSERAQSDHLNYQLSLPAEPLPQLMLDKRRLTQILNEIIDNAFKFTDKGEISVSLTHMGSTNTGVILEICISDTGVGMSPEVQSKIFEDFEQVEEFFKRNAEGSGIGLSLCNHLIRMMGGSIVLKPSPDTGSRFQLRFAFPISRTKPVRTAKDKPAITPLAPQPNSAPTATPETAKGMFSGKHLLVVEDNAVNQVVLTGLLKKMGMTLDLANNGQEAIDFFEEGKYEAILMDCQMPVMNGFEATKAIREIETGHIPIIAVTANTGHEDVEKCLASSMDAHIPKPFSPNRIGEVLKTFLIDRHQAEQATNYE